MVICYYVVLLLSVSLQHRWTNPLINIVNREILRAQRSLLLARIQRQQMTVESCMSDALSCCPPLYFSSLFLSIYNLYNIIPKHPTVHLSTYH